MATGQTQSQFRRHLSLFLLVGCLIGPWSARVDAATYEPASGGSFFLLSDASYATEETALVRFEAVDRGAVQENGGADIYIYKVPRPLEFLQKQKNLHRVSVDGVVAEEGLGNVLRHTWDSWYRRSRETWRALFSPDARQATLAEAPDLRAKAGLTAPSRYSQNPQYTPIKGLELKDSFRYPIMQARPIQPPEGVKLAGSSSEFVAAPQGNVMIPIGKQPPGLYLVEAMVGQHRATTLVFVADTVAVTKISSEQLLAWTVNRRTGQPVAQTRVLWTDGVGVLKSGSSDDRGIAVLERKAPEQTYVIGEDSAGGVFVSENFYYDSEIYNAKLYAVTDRPLYRPGDPVFIKVLGRDFVSGRESKPVAAGDLDLEVFDPNGLPVSRQKIRIAGDSGADTSFRLPDNAPAGGYEIRFAYKGDRYGAAFRVAEYQKPHFEISLLPAKSDFRTGEAISGRIQLSYPDGKPVKNASVELSVRSQQMTMVDGDLGYSGQFPLKLASTSLSTDSSGMASFSLPPASVPSRYVLTVFATDGAAYRVKVTREMLIERAMGAYTLKAERQFSSAGDAVVFAVTPVGEPGNRPVQWEWVRLEDRKRQDGKVADAKRLSVSFPAPGSYTVTLRDAQGNVVGAASHFVGGAGSKAPAGSIGIVFDRTEYKAGDTAEALLTFPVEVANALLTLERDKVEQSALLGRSSNWVRLEKVTPTQWRARLTVKEEHAPNITFSVTYVKDGDYVFQNQGIKVAQPKVQLEFRMDKTTYAPGETVNVEVLASAKGKPVAAATVAVGVVDEMIYVLQPEIAPDISEFFYHPRRNNVRTSASLSFIGFDQSRPRTGKGPSRQQVHERALKVLERPRREEVDTAYWNPRLTTDGEGRARFSFVMPDSLTRWRITGRAIEAGGLVGQKLAYLRSEKPVYVKWTSPNWLRENDSPIASVAVFNQTTSEQRVDFVAKGGGASKQEKLDLKPGANFVALPLKKSDGQPLVVSLSRDGKTLDSFQINLQQEAATWSSRRSLSVELKGDDTPLALPADARRVRLRLAASADAQISRIADDLIEYPYGCVEQTASRLIPLALAVSALGEADSEAAPLLRQQLYSQRFRLAQMAGPKARFAWWGDLTQESAFLTAYAYYADWLATRSLGLTLPREHWDRLLDVYAKQGYSLPPLQRALTLHWMNEIGLPVGSLADALVADLARANGPATTATGGSSITLSEPGSQRAIAAARLLAAHTAHRKSGSEETDVETLRQADQPFESALLVLVSKLPADQATTVLSKVRQDMPTFERAMSLVWSHRALGGKTGARPALPAPQAPWQSVTTASGSQAFVLAPQAALPSKLVVAGQPSVPVTAFVDFESRAPESHTLAVNIERKLYRLVKQQATHKSASGGPARRGESAHEGEVTGVMTEFTLAPIGPDDALRSDEIYLDEIVLRPTGSEMRYGVLEVALPPGASVERGTWGIALRRGQAVEAIEKARHENSRTGYTVALEPLNGAVTVRHLLRFAQRGQFALPPARFYRMYQPEQKAFEAKGGAWTQMRVE
jgi:alpha-2-macroglobulin